MKPRHLRSRAGLLIAAVLGVAALSGCAGPTDGTAAGLPVPSSAAGPATSPTLDPGAPVEPAGPPPVLSSLPETPEPETSQPATLRPVTSEIPAASAAIADSAPADTSAVLPASRPVRLQIPAIDVDSGLLDLGLQNDGTLQVPPDAKSAGWYTGAPTPGELGPAIIVAHVDWAGELGVFYDLRDLREGDEIFVTREDGSVATFRATSTEQFEKTAFPTDAVYGDIDHAGLRLITCGGDFDPQARSYLDNIVVFAALQS